MENWNINKNGYSQDDTSKTSKSKKLNILIDNFLWINCYLETDYRGELVLIKSVVVTDGQEASPEALGPANIVVETRVKNCC